MSVVDTARRLAAQHPNHRVVSLYLDLDPEEFAAPPARASQITSLIDEAAKRVEDERPELDHDDLIGLREDLDRVRDYLLSDEPPFEGARALAVFCSGRVDLFEVIQLTEPVEAQVVIENAPFVEPLIRAGTSRRWCVALVSRREARLFTGPADRLRELGSFEDGQHQLGGSQARGERRYEHEADEHLRHVAELLFRRYRHERYDRLALGGPNEVVARLEGFLHNDLRPALVGERLSIDLSSASDDDVRAAVLALAHEDDRAHEREALDRLAEGIGADGRAAGGPEDVLAALNERRVQTLLLDEQFDRAGGRCPTCGLISLAADVPCPTGDGGTLEPQAHIRESAITLAVGQDAEVIVVTQYSDLGTFQGIGAVLRF